MQVQILGNKANAHAIRIEKLQQKSDEQAAAIAKLTATLDGANRALAQSPAEGV
jgi:hypothetical protein